MFIIDDQAVTVECSTVLYFNVCINVILDRLLSSFTSIYLKHVLQIYVSE